MLLDQEDYREINKGESNHIAENVNNLPNEIQIHIFNYESVCS